MPHKFKRGDNVRQVLPAPVRGAVVGYALDPETGDVSVHVAGVIKDDKGAEHLESRYFADHQVEIDPDAKKEEKEEAKEE